MIGLPLLRTCPDCGKIVARECRDCTAARLTDAQLLEWFADFEAGAETYNRGRLDAVAKRFAGRPVADRAIRWLEG